MTEYKIITYNIDGLPDKLDLSTLPWVLKPIAWIYKMIKGTTSITINDNSNKTNDMKLLGDWLRMQNADIIAVQEDFNYHNELRSGLPGYIFGTYTGKFDLTNIFSNMTFFPPRFKADGINLFVKNNIKINKEDIVHWNISYGYLSHANDKLTYKGFRFYELNINGIDVDIYVVHMDADFYHPNNCPDVSKDVKARKSQITQLFDYIFYNRYDKGIKNPTIIIGDTNSYDKYEWDKENIEYLIKTGNTLPDMHCKEIVPENHSDCDRIFVINYDSSSHKLLCSDCYFDKSVYFSDHFPLIAKISFK